MEGQVQMLAIVGIVIVIVTVFGGYLLEGGHLEVLLQPIELLIIGGAAAGSLLISSPIPLLKAIVVQVIGALTKQGGASSAEYTDLLLLLYSLFKTAKSNPLSIEPHIEN